MEKYILILKLGSKYNICDRLIFDLVQCDVVDGKKISNTLDVFPYEIIAESLAKLHNNGLIFINLNTGKIQLTVEVQKINDLLKDEDMGSIIEREKMKDVSEYVMQNFSGKQKVIL